MLKSKANTQNAFHAVRDIKRSVTELLEEYLPNDLTLGDNGVAELVTEIENKAELIVLRWEKSGVSVL